MPIVKTPVNPPDEKQPLIPQDVQSSEIKQNIADISYFNNSSNIQGVKSDLTLLKKKSKFESYRRNKRLITKFFSVCYANYNCCCK
jgi:hypothetical protein